MSSTKCSEMSIASLRKQCIYTGLSCVALVRVVLNGMKNVFLKWLLCFEC